MNRIPYVERILACANTRPYRVVIQDTRGAVGTSTSGASPNVTGFVKRYSYDRCAVMNPPPYFPTTGRFQDNRYYELDPVNLNLTQLFKSLSPNG